MMQRITNHGRRPIQVSLRSGAMVEVLPGNTLTCDAVQIHHGNVNAHYTVETVEQEARINV